MIQYHLGWTISILRVTMEFGAKSMAVTNNANVDINFDMDEVLKRIQSSRNVAGVMVINNEGKYRMK